MGVRSLSTTALRRELTRRERGGTKLLAERRRLSERLAKLDAELSALGVDEASRRMRRPGRRASATPKGASRLGHRRPKNSLTLLDALQKAVRPGATVSPREAAVAAKKVGYRTSSKTFGIQVATTLAKEKGFKRTGRGAYLRVSQ